MHCSTLTRLRTDQSPAKAAVNRIRSLFYRRRIHIDLPARSRKVVHEIRHLRRSQSDLLQLTVMPKHLSWHAIKPHLSFIHDNDPVDVPRDILHTVGNEDDCDMPLLMQTLHLIQNVISSLRIKPRGRLIEHEHIRLHRKDPGDRHTALLSARKLERRLFKILLLQSDKPQCLIRSPLDLLLWKTEILRAKADVCKYIDLEQLVLRIL